jgi:outer membrane protein
LAQARQTALLRHPTITVARLLSFAAYQVADQARSAFYPTVNGNLAAVGADHENARMVSTGLPVSAVVDRAGASVFVNQLITDFGRTSNLLASAKQQAGAQDQNTEAAREQVLLAVDRAYIDSLRFRSLLGVAQQTVKTRRLLRDRVAALAANALRSPLDVSFAEVDLQQSLLLLSHTENDLASAYATLAALLDEPTVDAYQLEDESQLGPPSSEVSNLITMAVHNRPDLRKLTLARDSAFSFAKAERALNFPTVNAQAAAGDLPYHDSSTNHNYAAGGITVNWPIFNGRLYAARQQEAVLRAQAAEAVLHDATNDAIRDVRIAWLSLGNAFKNIGITAKLEEQARKSLALAQARYDAGSSAIVELSQAQLTLTSAEIDATAARYEYLLRQSILAFQTGGLK